MRAVWSFWSKPFLAERRSSWFSEFHHWLAWGLSLEVASRNYPETQLVTDDAGARILIDRLKMPFANVSTELNALEDQDPGWWALGKLEAYRIQEGPFVHIDTDVFLWSALRPALQAADVFAQNPEPIRFGSSCYRPEDLERSLGYPQGGWIPKEWPWYRECAPHYARAECCGIFGGNRLDFIRYYATNALRLVTDPHNRSALERFEDKNGSMILIEQYLLTACLEYHSGQERSPFAGIGIRYVFDSIGDAYRRECATEAGFTHLAAGAKRDPVVARNLGIRVERDLPEHFARCADLVSACAASALTRHCSV
jgi:hypothetical protein